MIAPADDFALYDWLTLERIPRVGPLTIAKLHSAFGSPRAALEAGADKIRRLAGLSEQLAQTISGFVIPKDEILKDIEILAKLQVRVITRWDPDYPLNLKEIYDPPALLFVRGEIKNEDNRAVAIVGTRNPTRYGIEMTERISTGLVQAGITLVSGLARGIDTACHQTAIKEQGRTIGVLGCGTDVSYPKENKKLIREMPQHGAVISEFRPGIAPLATNFYRRNRIVSGLVKGVLVVEAARNSGSLITANHAVDQNRDVFAVPGNLMNPRSHGCHYLIKNGAGLIESADDVIDALFPVTGKKVQETLFQAQNHAGDLSDEAESVLGALDPDPVPIDLLCENLKIDVGKLAGLLLELELKGLIRQHPGKMFSRILR